MDKDFAPKVPVACIIFSKWEFCKIAIIHLSITTLYSEILWFNAILHFDEMFSMIFFLFILKGYIWILKSNYLLDCQIYAVGSSNLGKGVSRYGGSVLLTSKWIWPWSRAPHKNSRSIFVVSLSSRCFQSRTKRCTPLSLVFCRALVKLPLIDNLMVAWSGLPHKYVGCTSSGLWNSFRLGQKEWHNWYAYEQDSSCISSEIL